MWKEQHNNAVEAIHFYELKKRVDELEGMMKLHGSNMQRLKEKQQLKEQLALFERSKIYATWKEVNAEWKMLVKSIEDMVGKLQIQELTWKQNNASVLRVQHMSNLIQSFTARKTLVQLFESRFIGDKANNDGYKEWIYREKVVPLLETEVNKFLSNIEGFKLRIQYDKKCFIYYLEDRGNMPTLDKASGYQNFVVGIAMRLALSRIGAVGQNVKHLFIDEGFTACDVMNIEKVPLLLKSIMTYGGYHSIILMSHLEQVRDAASIQVQIERQGVFSKIQYGSTYPVLTTLAQTEVAKKRGRPKKQ